MTPTAHRPRRVASGLLALVLTLALGLLLVALVVPFFQDCCLCGGGRTKSGQDLEVIKKAVSLHDAREPLPLRGTSLRPLLGRFMQEIPLDPWGHEYLFDGELGVLASLGEDQRPGGSQDATDLVVFTRPWEHTGPERYREAAEQIYRRQGRARVERIGWLDL